VEFRSEEHRIAVKAALIRISSDPAWNVMRQLAEEVVYGLERKAIDEDDEAKANTFRNDARGARKFWEKWLSLIEVTKSGEGADNFLEVIM